eukprot:9525710-Ditylum_brightwellii.AAC.1
MWSALVEAAAKARKTKEKERAKMQKTTVIADGNEKDEKVEKHKSTQERIADGGAKYVGGTTQHQTLVKVEFHIKGKTKTFPVRVKLISLLNKLKEGDKQVKCCLSDNTKEWNDFIKLPIGE